MDFKKKFLEANKELNAKPKGFIGLLYAALVAIIVFIIIVNLMPTAVTGANTNSGDATVNTLQKLVPLLIIAGVLIAYVVGLLGGKGAR